MHIDIHICVYSEIYKHYIYRVYIYPVLRVRDCDTSLSNYASSMQTALEAVLLRKQIDGDSSSVTAMWQWIARLRRTHK